MTGYSIHFELVDDVSGLIAQHSAPFGGLVMKPISDETYSDLIEEFTTPQNELRLKEVRFCGVTDGVFTEPHNIHSFREV